MEIIILISLDLLFLILLACCVSLDKRMSRLEKAWDRRFDRLAMKVLDCRRELEALKYSADKPGDAAEEENEGEEERLKDKLAEKRFTDGIASILAYDSGMGRRAVNAEGK